MISCRNKSHAIFKQPQWHKMKYAESKKREDRRKKSEVGVYEKRRTHEKKEEGTCARIKGNGKEGSAIVIVAVAIADELKISANPFQESVDGMMLLFCD